MGRLTNLYPAKLCVAKFNLNGRNYFLCLEIVCGSKESVHSSNKIHGS